MLFIEFEFVYEVLPDAIEVIGVVLVDGDEAIGVMNTEATVRELVISSCEDEGTGLAAAVAMMAVAMDALFLLSPRMISSMPFLSPVCLVYRWFRSLFFDFGRYVLFRIQ